MVSIEELAEGFNAALNAHDATKIGEHVAEDITYWEANLPEPINGREAVEAHFRANWEAFPDASIRVVNRLVSGDSLAEEGEWTGTNTGPIQMGPDQTVPATGKQARGAYVAVVETSDDKISSMRIYYDSMTFLAQLGLVEPPSSG
ncbi:MAG: ester cyclase [Thermoplasmata archaeon]